MKTYDIDDNPLLVAKFYVLSDPTNPDSTKIPTNPTTVVFTLYNRTTATTIALPAAINTAVGTYTCQTPTATVAGVYEWRVKATGAVTAGEQGEFQVRPNNTI